MLVQVSLRDDALRDVTGWALIKTGAALHAWDFVNYSSGQDDRFLECFGDAGAYAKGWWDGDARERSLKTSSPAAAVDPMITPSQAEFDLRFASVVELIPAGEIDRTDTTLRNDEHPWTERDAIVAKINARLPWYQPSSDATLASSPIPSTTGITGLSDFRASLGYYTGSTSRSFVAFRAALSFPHAVLTATVNGVSASAPTSFNATLRNGGNSIQLKITAQDQETIMTYTYDINRTSG